MLEADPQRGILRMSGALGPLQGEKLNGILTITLFKANSGTRIEPEYVAGGYMRLNREEFATSGGYDTGAETDQPCRRRKRFAARRSLQAGLSLKCGTNLCHFPRSV